MALQPPDAELARVGVQRRGDGALCGLLLLQVLQRARQPEGGAVEVAPPQLKGEQEAARRHQLVAPGRQAGAADCKHILRTTGCVCLVAFACTSSACQHHALPGTHLELLRQLGRELGAHKLLASNDNWAAVAQQPPLRTRLMRSQVRCQPATSASRRLTDEPQNNPPLSTPAVSKLA